MSIAILYLIKQSKLCKQVLNFIIKKNNEIDKSKKIKIIWKVIILKFGIIWKFFKILNKIKTNSILSL